MQEPQPFQQYLQLHSFLFQGWPSFDCPGFPTREVPGFPTREVPGFPRLGNTPENWLSGQYWVISLICVIYNPSLSKML